MEYYKRTEVENKLHISNFISFHYFEYVKEFAGIGESHDFWEMVYIDYGNVKVVSDDREFLVSSGEGFLHAPNELHNILSAGDFASAFIISFDCDCAELSDIQSKILKFYGEESQIVKKLYAVGQTVFEEPYDIFSQQKLIPKSDMPYGGLQELKNLTEMLLLILIRKSSVKGDVREKYLSKDFANERMIVDKVIRIILSSVYKKTTLDNICSQLSFSKSYILKVFKKQMGCSVMEYYNQMKIKEAKRLISEEQFTYTQIARLLHFSSVHHFSSSFKQITNMTPSGYQKSVKNRSVI